MIKITMNEKLLEFSTIEEHPAPEYDLIVYDITMPVNVEIQTLLYGPVKLTGIVKLPVADKIVATQIYRTIKHNALLMRGPISPNS